MPTICCTSKVFDAKVWVPQMEFIVGRGVGQEGLPAVPLAHQLPPAERVNTEVVHAVGAEGGWLFVIV